MDPIQHILNRYPVMIVDGAMATELEKHGCNLHDPLWSAKILVEQPEIIKQVHHDYFVAGADCTITASYQATIEGFMQKGFTALEAIDLIKKSVTLAVDARDDFWLHYQHKSRRPKPLVAASVGPYGAYLADGSEYTAIYTVSEKTLYDFHYERIALLVEAGADLLACETIPSLIEAKTLAKVIKVFPQITAWISFSAKDEKHINDGHKIADCAALLDKEQQITAIGINCTSPYYISPLIKEVKGQTRKPIIVYPNSGETYDPRSKTWSNKSAIDHFNDFTKEWFEAGASIIGGCCRTTPDNIKALANWARTSNNTSNDSCK